MIEITIEIIMTETIGEICWI